MSLVQTCQYCVAQQTDVKNNTYFMSEHVFFAIEWLNSMASAGSDSYCMYSHPPLPTCCLYSDWLIYSLSAQQKKKIRIENEIGRRGLLSRLRLVSQIYTFPSRDINYSYFTCFYWFYLVSHGFSSHFHFVMPF